MALKPILTAAQINALPDAEWLALVATGEVIPATDVATHLEDGNRVYAIADRDGAGIVRIQWAHEADGSHVGYWLGVNAIPVGRA